MNKTCLYRTGMTYCQKKWSMTYIEVTPHWRYFNVSTNSRAWFMSASASATSHIST